VVCATGSYCSSGACTCSLGLTNCNGVCVDTRVDASNCGSCGGICPGTQQCRGGRCVAL
jgi:hypothetical protein